MGVAVSPTVVLTFALPFVVLSLLLFYVLWLLFVVLFVCFSLMLLILFIYCLHGRVVLHMCLLIVVVVVVDCHRRAPHEPRRPSLPAEDGAGVFRAYLVHLVHATSSQWLCPGHQ